MSGIAIVGTPTNVTFNPFATADGTAVKISGDLAADCSNSGGLNCLASIEGYLHSTVGSAVLVHYEFTINTSGPDSIFWGFETQTGDGYISLASGNVSGSGPHQVSGDFLADLNILRDDQGTPGYLYFGASSFDFGGNPQPFTISIPSNSIDFLPQSAAVPEPSTVVLGLAGVAAIAFRRRR